jgi:hypothetical protein
MKQEKNKIIENMELKQNFVKKATGYGSYPNLLEKICGFRCGFMLQKKFGNK